MNQFDYRPYYRRHLPHIQPGGATLFVTTRLAGSMPRGLLLRLQAEAGENAARVAALADSAERASRLREEQEAYFRRFDDFLDQAISGPTWLIRPDVAPILAEALHYRDGNVFDLHTYTIMPNHLHAIFTPLVAADDGWQALQKIMHSLKRYTARKVNQRLGRQGPFWQQESYDHVVRDRRDWDRLVRYVLNNPVKAGLVSDWEEWPWSYLKEV